MQRRHYSRTLRAIVFFLRPILMVLTKRDWQGQDKLPDGGYVIAPNHISHLDPFMISHFMVDNGIPPRFLAKTSLMNVAVLGRILRNAEQIPVYRNSASAADSLVAAIAAVEAGNVVSIYPEGTITRDPAAWPMTGRTGAVRVALATGKPLVPMMQWGAQEILWPYTKRPRFFPRKTMHVHVGDPIDLSDFEGREITEQVLRDATARLMDTLTAMMVEVRGEAPSTPRIDVHTLSKSNRTYKH
ncbi:lysophospholipid acyltransferase family protein [Aeromicrobium sp. UC242_57]|uniref:lysophospholipid acyltransferase family protein n=1 Tax=Aeromicrobium sp. UC242_57 TaxID=3374624 RepID=UPI0037A05679